MAFGIFLGSDACYKGQSVVRAWSGFWLRADITSVAIGVIMGLAAIFGYFRFPISMAPAFHIALPFGLVGMVVLTDIGGILFGKFMVGSHVNQQYIDRGEWPNHPFSGICHALKDHFWSK